MEKAVPKSNFLNANGIRLHYLDWGGEGETLLFIPGLGGTAYIFNRLAQRFTDKFHVLGLTRRGHGDSDYPDSGYDLETLTEDLRQFLDALGIDKVIFAGSSWAYVEICHFAALYPERVLKVVYLDAAYDRTKFKVFERHYPLKGIRPPGADSSYFSMDEYRAYLRSANPEIADIWSDLFEEEVRHEVEVTPEGQILEKMSDERSQTFIEISRRYAPEDTKTKAPVLSIYAIPDISVMPDYLTNEQKAKLLKYRKGIRLPILRECIEKFRQDVPHARIIEIPQGNHWVFIKHEEIVFEEMRKFLLDGSIFSGDGL